MKTDFNFDTAKVGDKVYHYRKGWTFLTDVKINCISTDNDANTFYLNGNLFPNDLNPTVYPYNPFENNQERVVEVRNYNHESWEKRVLIKEINGKAICWRDAETIEDSKNKYYTHTWNEWREIQEPQKELTQEEKINLLWDKFGNDIC